MAQQTKIQVSIRTSSGIELAVNSPPERALEELREYESSRSHNINKQMAWAEFIPTKGYEEYERHRQERTRFEVLIDQTWEKMTFSELSSKLTAMITK